MILIYLTTMVALFVVANAKHQYSSIKKQSYRIMALSTLAMSVAVYIRYW